MNWSSVCDFVTACAVDESVHGPHFAWWGSSSGGETWHHRVPRHQ